MVEADPVRTLTKTGGIHLLKRSAPQPGAPSGPTKAPPAEPAPIKSQPSPPSAASTPPAAPASPSSPPPSQPAAVSVAPEVKKADPPLMPFGSIFHRKAKMTELARIVLPRKREESEPPPAPSESSPTVVPPAFPVAAMTVRASQPAAGAAHSGNNEVSPPEKAPDAAAKTEKTASPETAPASPSAAEAKPAAPLPAVPDAPPKVDPEAHKPEPSATPLPKIDPEAHQTPPAPATALPLAQPTAPSDTPERREFHLANGERVAGIVLSETPEAVYIDHGTLGVLTIPRAQIARRLVEIILINGDRIVGDIMAETADTLYVRHASLGMLTVPRAQRSTRVVEAILKDGDRILGEVLTETDAFTVIRSATLGTITVPHGKISMLNRKIEQIELKALPPSAPEIKDKPTG